MRFAKQHANKQRQTVIRKQNSSVSKASVKSERAEEGTSIILIDDQISSPARPAVSPTANQLGHWKYEGTPKDGIDVRQSPNSPNLDYYDDIMENVL